MIPAEKAERIMQLYEADYDNFLKGLRAKHAQKREAAKKTKAEADKSDATVKKAEGHKKGHLAEKAKKLIDKNGGISGIADTVQNVTKYFKPSDAPADYEVGVGKTEDDKGKDKTILGMPSMVVYIGGPVILIAVLYGISRLVTKPQPTPKATTTLTPPPIQPAA